MSVLLWILLSTAWITDGLPARGDDEHYLGWREAGDRDLLVLEKRKTDDDGRYVLPYKVPDGGSWQPGTRPVYAKATCTSAPGRVVCHLGRYTFVINNGEHKMEPEVIERFAAMLYHRTQEGDTNFDVAVETPAKEEALCGEAARDEPLQTRDLSGDSPVYVECSPVREERRGEVVYSCRRHGLGKRETLLAVHPSGAVTDGQFVLPFSRVVEKRSAPEGQVDDLGMADLSEEGAAGSQGAGSSASVPERSSNSSSDGLSSAQADQSPNASAEKASDVPADPSNSPAADRSPSAPSDPSPAASPIASSGQTVVVAVDRSSPVDSANPSPVAAANRPQAVAANGPPVASAERSQNEKADKVSSATADQPSSAPGVRVPIVAGDRPVVAQAERSPSVAAQVNASAPMSHNSPIENISIEKPLSAVGTNTWAKMEAEHRAINSQNPASNQVSLENSLQKSSEEIHNAPVNGSGQETYKNGVHSEIDSFRKFNEALSKEIINKIKNKFSIDNAQEVENAEKSSNTAENNKELNLSVHLVQTNLSKLKNDENSLSNTNMNKNSRIGNEITPNLNENTNKMKSREGMVSAETGNSLNIHTIESISNDIKTDNNKDNSHVGNPVNNNLNNLKCMEGNFNIHSNIAKELVSKKQNEKPSMTNNLKINQLSRTDNMKQDVNYLKNLAEQGKSGKITEINLNSEIGNRGYTNSIIINGKSNIEDNNRKEAINPSEKTQSDLNSSKAIEKNSIVQDALKSNLNLSANHVQNIDVANNVVHSNLNVESKKDGSSVTNSNESTKLKAPVPLARIENMDASDMKITAQVDIKNNVKTSCETPNAHDVVKIENVGPNAVIDREEKPISAHGMILNKNISTSGSTNQNTNHLANENMNSNLSSSGTNDIVNSEGKVINNNEAKDSPIDKDSSEISLSGNSMVNSNTLIDGNLNQTNLQENSSLISIEVVPFSISKYANEKKSNDHEKTFVLNVDRKKLVGFKRQNDVKIVLTEPSNPRIVGPGPTRNDRIGQFAEDVFALPPEAKDLQENLADFSRNLPAPVVRNFSDTCYSDYIPGQAWCPNTPRNTECPEKGCVTCCEQGMNKNWQGPGSRRKRQQPKKRQACPPLTTTCPTTTRTTTTTTTTRPTTAPTCATTAPTCSTTTACSTTTTCKSPTTTTCSKVTERCPITCGNTSNTTQQAKPPSTSCGPPLDPPGEVPACFKPPPPVPCKSSGKGTCPPRLQRRAVCARHSAKKKKKMALRQMTARGGRPEGYQAAYA